MSNNLKVGLMGLVAVALIVNGYFLLKKSDGSSTPAGTEDVANEYSTPNEKDGSNANVSTTNSKDPASQLKTHDKKGDAAKTVDPNLPKTSMTFQKMEHNYGKVEQNTVNEYVFKFTNSGTSPLLIANAKGSCGCTVPDYPKEPIMPGEDGEIKVEYSSRTSKGTQTKTVNITANTVPEQTQLKIIADVQEGAAAAAK